MTRLRTTCVNFSFFFRINICHIYSSISHLINSIHRINVTIFSIIKTIYRCFQINWILPIYQTSMCHTIFSILTINFKIILICFSYFKIIINFVLSSTTSSIISRNSFILYNIFIIFNISHFRRRIILNCFS